MVLQECVGFSELAPSNYGKAMFATTWRKCQSFTCRGAGCEPLVRSGLYTIIDTFFSDFQQRNFRKDLPIPQIGSQPQAIVTPAEAPQPVDGSSAFYLLYITTCVTVLVYWQCREYRHRL